MALSLALSPIRVMEPAIIERLRLAFPAKTFTINRIPQVLTIKEFERIAHLSPFIGLAWTGMKPDAASGRALKGDMLWRLVLIFKASSGLETRFKGDAKGLGLDAMSDVSIALLHGITFDGIGKSTVTGANSIIADGWTDDAIVISQVDFTVSFVTSPADFTLKTPEDFKRLGITWSIEGAKDGSPKPTDELDPPQT